MRVSNKIKWILLTSAVLSVCTGVYANNNSNLSGYKMSSLVKIEKSVIEIINDKINERVEKSEVEKELSIAKLEEENSIEIPVLNETKSISYINNITKDGSGVTYELVDLVDSKLKMVPNKVVEKFFDGGGQLILTDKDIASVYYKDSSLGRISGLHDGNKNIVYISARAGAIENALIHEFGHVLDCLVGWASWKEDFIQIYKSEMNTLEIDSIDGHYKRNEREFFAEVFQQLILNPDICKSTAPKSSAFIEEKLNSLK